MSTENSKECSNCTNKCPKFKCAKCLTTSYCSKKCQINNWKSHKHCCESYSKQRIDIELKYNQDCKNIDIYNENIKNKLDYIKYPNKPEVNLSDYTCESGSILSIIEINKSMSSNSKITM